MASSNPPKGVKRTISDFFGPRKRAGAEGSAPAPSPSPSGPGDGDVDQGGGGEGPAGEVEIVPCNHKADEVPVQWATRLDVGYFAKIPTHEIPSSTLAELLRTPWVPPVTYKFPFSVHMKQGKEEHRFVGHKQLQNYNWLVFSDMDKGLYCKYCPFFVPGNVGGKSKVNLGALVKQPLTKFAKLTGSKGELETHAKHAYHINAVEAAMDFLRCRESGENVGSQLDTYHSRLVKENRARLMCSVENVIFLGRQGLALRGHRETVVEDPDHTCNKGNFLELLDFRRECGDPRVEKHLSTATQRNVYKSKVVQNDIIDACGAEITSIIVSKVNRAKFYSILFDETTDISHVSQLSLSVRYPDVDDSGKVVGVREDFLRFIDARQVLEELMNPVPKVRELDEDEDGDSSGAEDAEDDVDADICVAADTETENIGIGEDLELALTGVNLGKVTVKSMIEIGLNTNYCVGIGADGCSTNTSATVGAIQEIQKTAPNAVRAPCGNHILNLSVSKTSNVPSVKKAIHTMKEVGAFFRASSKRHRSLLKKFKRTLPKLCETRWVERHDAVTVFHDGFDEISNALTSISGWKEPDTAGKAGTLLDVLHQPEFVATLCALRDILSTTVSLSRFLQKETIEMQQASDAVLDTINVLEEKRRSSEENFGVLFQEAEEIALKFDINLQSLPRAAGRGKHPTPTGNAESYYRQTVFNSMLDFLVTDLKQRLSPEVLRCFELHYLIPSVLLEHEGEAEEALSGYALRYAKVLETPSHILKSNLRAEWQIWRAKWRREKSAGRVAPYSCVNSLAVCDVELFPTIRSLLLILLALPSSIATAERSFSNLRRLKSWLRSTMRNTRLNGLALLAIHHDIPVNKEKVIDRFASMNKLRKKKLKM